MSDEFVRVRDKETGHHYSTKWVDEDRHEVLDKPAVDAEGRPLPEKTNVNKRPASDAGDTTKKAASATEKEK